MILRVAVHVYMAWYQQALYWYVIDKVTNAAKNMNHIMGIH